MNFGQILRELREERGIYQKELASYLNVSISTISNYENGVHFPDLDVLCQIAEFFNISTDYLLGRTQYQYDIKMLNQSLTSEYTVTNLINTIIELPGREKESLLEYVEYLKTRPGK